MAINNNNKKINSNSQHINPNNKRKQQDKLTLTHRRKYNI